MSEIDELLRRNEAYAASFDQGHLPAAPSRRLAIVTCMDARIDVHRILGLREGEAHILRNAGGVVHGGRDPVPDDLPAPAGHTGDHAHPSYGLRHADVPG